MKEVTKSVEEVNKFLKSSKVGYSISMDELIRDIHPETGKASERIKEICAHLQTLNNPKISQLFDGLSEAGPQSLIMNLLLQLPEDLREELEPIKQEILQFMLDYYFMCNNDEDILEERWIENPSFILTMLKLEFLKAQKEQTQTLFVSAPSVPLEAAAEVPSLPGLIPNNLERRDREDDPLCPILLKIFAKIFSSTQSWSFDPEEVQKNISSLRKYLFYKEEIHQSYTRQNFFICHLLRELGRRWKLQGILQSENDLFFLDYETLSAYLAVNEGGGGGGYEADDSMLQLLSTMLSHKIIRRMFEKFEKPTCLTKGKNIKVHSCGTGKFNPVDQLSVTIPHFLTSLDLSDV